LVCKYRQYRLSAAEHRYFCLLFCLAPNIKRLQFQEEMNVAPLFGGTSKEHIGLVVKLGQYVFRRDGEYKHESFGGRMCGARPD
jgi:hypothetical protein